MRKRTGPIGDIFVGRTIHASTGGGRTCRRDNEEEEEEEEEGKMEIERDMQARAGIQSKLRVT